MEMPPGIPDEVPSYWVSIFEVDDCDAAAARIQELGGTVAFGPETAEGVGRFAYAFDPQGAQFGVITSVTPDE
jgi:predicted enzyme related to lactoylglutathione lyase